MDLINENFRNCKFGAIEQMLKEGKRDEVVKAIDSFEKCLFLEREARMYSRIMECAVDYVTLHANSVEMYKFVWRNSDDADIKKSIIDTVSELKIDLNGLKQLLFDRYSAFIMLGVEKIEEVNFSFKEGKKIYGFVPGHNRHSSSIQLALLKKMLKISTSYKEKIWILDRFPTNHPDINSAIVKDNIARYLW